MAAPTSAATPPLLLTKRLNAFLHGHQTPQLPTLLLTTSHGKLLAHASARPVSVLRTHATVAASLLAIHTSSSVAISSALPGSRTPEPPLGSSPALSDRDDGDEHGGHGLAGEEEEKEDDDRHNHYHHDYDHHDDDDDHRRRLVAGAAAAARTSSTFQRRQQHKQQQTQQQKHKRNAIKPVTITVQLSGGTVIIRRLKCGLLFVCVGPSSSSSSSAAAAAAHALEHHHLHLHHHENGDATAAAGVGSPSEVESLISAGGQTISSLESASAAPVVAMRRHAAELARWLDEKLGTLRVPEEGIGVAE